MPRIEAPTVAEHTAMRRQRIVDAAVETLAELGVSGFTPAQVAQRAGIARSSIYQYHPSTEALLGAAVEAMLTRAAERVAAAMGEAPTPRAKVLAYVHQAFEDVERGHAVVPQDVVGLNLPTEYADAVRRLHTDLLGPLTDALQAAGVADPSVAAQLSAMLVSAASGSSRAPGHGSGATRESIEKATSEFVLRGVGLADG